MTNKKFAEMTEARANVYLDRTMSTDADVDALIDAVRAEVIAERAPMEDTIAALRIRAERAERERDAAKREAAGFKAWVERAESALVEARRRAFCDGATWEAYERDSANAPARDEATRRYPATPSGEGQHTMYPTGAFAATPQPEPLVIPVEDTFGVPRITITPDLARRIIAMGQEGTYL